jgi:hypothetical protein
MFIIITIVINILFNIFDILIYLYCIFKQLFGVDLKYLHFSFGYFNKK